MIKGGFWIHVTCDKCGAVNEFTRATKAQAIQAARKAGWAMMWYPGGRKELVEVEPSQVHSLDDALARLESNHKTYVALENVVAVAERGW